MIHLKATFSVLALSSALLAAPMVAQAHDVGHRHESGAKHHHKAGFNGHHHAWKKLDLSEEQKDKMFELRHAQAPVVRDLHKDVKAARLELREIAKADTFDEDKAKAASDKLAQAQASLNLHRLKHQSEVKAILTADQRKTLAEQKAKRGKRGGDSDKKS